MDILSRSFVQEVRKTLKQVDEQIGSVMLESEKMGVEARDLRDQHGVFVLIPLISAKAQLLHTLALLQKGP